MDPFSDLSYDEYRTLFDSLDLGFCVIEMKISPDQPLDYRFLEVNKAFEKQAKLLNARGKWMRQLRPDHEEYWFEIYRDVAVKRIPVRFEQLARALSNTWFEVNAFPVGEPAQLRLAIVFNDITERKETFAKLKTSQELLSVMFDRSPFGILLSSEEDGRIIQVNDSFQEIFDMKADDVIGKTTIDLNIYNSRADRDKLVERTKKEGSIRNMELVMRRSTGEKISVLISAELIKTEGVLNLLITVNDISDLKRAELAVIESEKLFRNLFERHGSIMLLIEQTTGQIVDANNSAAKFYGYTRSHLRNMNISQINQLPPEELLAERLRVTRNEKVYFQFPHRIASGEIKWVEVNSSSVRYKGKILLFSVINDISVQKRIANELVKSELQFRSTFENAAVGMALLNKDGRWVKVNTKLSVITQYSAAELSKLTFMDLTHPLDKDIGKREIDTIWEKGTQLYNGEKRYVRKDGKVIWVRITASPMIDREEKIMYLIAVIEEITDQKNIQEQIEKANRELQITYDFMESVLHIAMHDLRSPVANLQLCIQCIEMEESQEGKEKYFHFFKEIVNKLIVTLNDLTGILEFVGNKKITAMVVNIPSVIESVIREHQQAIGDGVIKYDTRVVEFRYIKPFIESLVRNLVGNSVKYRSTDRQLRIRVMSYRKGSYTVICVEDNGIGIDLQKHGESLFQPFKRFTDRAEGIGIGLYLVRNIVERNGGCVKIESKVDEGTTIFCYLREYET